MQNFPFKRVISFLVLICFIFCDLASAAPPNNKSFFQNRKPNYQKISEQNEALLNKKRAIHQGEIPQAQGSRLKAQEETKIEIASLKDISDIHISESLGRITEVWNSPLEDSKRIIHFQDLHTNYEAQKNSSKIIEHLYKTYNIDLVLSEGAFGKVDPTIVKELIKDKLIRDRASKLLMRTGELTGEEYLGITKDYPIKIFGIEDKTLYNKNLEQFNRVIKYSNDAQVFLSQVENAVRTLKPLVYNKTLKELEEKEALFNEKKIELNDYLNYLTQVAKNLNLDISNPYINLDLLQKSLTLEKTLNAQKVQEELRLYLTLLNQRLQTKDQRPQTKDLQEFTRKTLLFNQQKLSPIKFYTFLKALGDKNNLPTTNYKNLTTYIESVAELLYIFYIFIVGKHLISRR